MIRGMYFISFGLVLLGFYLLTRVDKKKETETMEKNARREANGRILCAMGLLLTFITSGLYLLSAVFVNVI